MAYYRKREVRGIKLSGASTFANFFGFKPENSDCGVIGEIVFYKGTFEAAIIAHESLHLVLWYLQIIGKSCIIEHEELYASLIQYVTESSLQWKEDMNSLPRYIAYESTPVILQE